MKIAYCVLAGGRSHRFGDDKRLSVLGGKRLVDYPILLLSKYTDAVYISGRFDDDFEAEAVLIRDDEPFGGPLCGIYSVMKNVEADGYVFLSGDMPFVSVPMVDAIVESLMGGSDAVMFECEGNWTPLPLGVSRRVFEFFGERGCGNRRIKELIDAYGGTVLKWKVCANFFNVNTRYDLDVASIILGGASEDFSRFLVYEQQVSIHLNNKKLVSLSVTPAFLKEFVRGYLYSGGYTTPEDELTIECKGGDIFVDVFPRGGVVRHSSSSFILNKETIKKAMSVFNDNIYLHGTVGGYHGGALFSGEGRLIFINEDVSKYNTIDKCIGYALLNGIDMSEVFFVTSGRLTALSMRKLVNGGIRFAVSGSNITKDAFDMAMKHGIGVGRYVNKKREEIILGE